MRNYRIILISLAVGLAAGLLSLYWAQSYWLDLNSPLCSARALLSGLSPYRMYDPETACIGPYLGKPAAQYPLTTFLAFIPFAPLPGYTGASAAWGVINALLAFAILRSGKPWRLLVFASMPYAMAFIYHQISPLLAAVLLLPGLLPLALVKPQLGLPIILTHLTPRRAAACAAFGLLTFIIRPTWPLEWWEVSQYFDGRVPLLTLPFGPLLLLSLLRFRSREAWLLFLFACIPQRSPYDLVPLVLLAGSRRQMVALLACGWVGMALALYRLPLGVPEGAVPLSILAVYLPLMVMQLAPPAYGALTRITSAWLASKSATSAANSPATAANSTRSPAG